jgi:hypothetical protein
MAANVENEVLMLLEHLGDGPGEDDGGDETDHRGKLIQLAGLFDGEREQCTLEHVDGRGENEQTECRVVEPFNVKYI